MTISKDGTAAMVKNLRSEGHVSRADYLEAMDAQYWQMYKALADLLNSFGKDGAFAVCLKSGESMGLGDLVLIGDKFQAAQEAIDVAKNI